MNNRRRMTGVVTSDKMTKTVVVEVSRSYQHPLYKKVVHASNRFKAHDELGAKIGDLVEIVESRPISRDKRWVVQSIVRRAGEAARAPEVISELEVEPEVVTEETVVEEAAEQPVENAEETGAEETGEGAEETGEGAEETSESAETTGVDQTGEGA